MAGSAAAGRGVPKEGGVSRGSLEAGVGSLRSGAAAACGSPPTDLAPFLLCGRVAVLSRKAC